MPFTSLSLLFLFWLFVSLLFPLCIFSEILFPPYWFLFLPHPHIRAASGMYEHRYYEATLNNRSLALCDRRRRLWGHIHIHKYTDTNIQSKWGTLPEGSNLLVPSPSAALLVAFTGFHLKVTNDTAADRGAKISITRKGHFLFTGRDIITKQSYVEKQSWHKH